MDCAALGVVAAGTKDGLNLLGVQGMLQQACLCRAVYRILFTMCPDHSSISQTNHKHCYACKVAQQSFFCRHKIDSLAY